MLCPAVVVVAGEIVVAKSQQKSNKEIRKPKAEKAPKQNASNPSTKGKPAEEDAKKR